MSYASFLYSLKSHLGVRSADGSGNNVYNTDWGKAHSEFVRITENSYLDGLNAMAVHEAFNGDYPSARSISDAVMDEKTGNIPNSFGINEYFQFFGQFLTHDIAEAEIPGPVVPPGERLAPFDGIPFPFTRTPAHYDEYGVRQQENEVTSFLDLGTVYGKSDLMLDILVDASTGKLVTGGDGNIMLPTFKELFDHHTSAGLAALGVSDTDGSGAIDIADLKFVMVGVPAGPPVDDFDYVSGDARSNQNVALLTHQFTWARNHNWHVEQLYEKFGDSWSASDYFKAARALNEAEWQHVVYDEYLKKLVGEYAISEYSGYNSKVDPSVINEWTSTAFRFGHDQSNNEFNTLDESGKVVAELVTLAQSFTMAGDDSSVRESGVIDEWIRGQLSVLTQEIDGKVVDGNRNLLFNIGGGRVTTDLETLDIQRGRDHGVGNYLKLIEGLADYGYKGRTDFKDFWDFGRYNNLSNERIQDLIDAYGEDGIGKMDSIVGGLLEQRYGDSMMGEAFTLLTVMQFENLRDGDRYYFEERFGYDPELVDAIKSTSLADIIKRTSDVEYLYRDAFLAHEREGGTEYSDWMKGSKGLDLMIGFDGADHMYGRKGNDDLYGCDGDDKMWGGGGDDHMYGGAGHDKLRGSWGSDLMDGGSGYDALNGGKGDDYMLGGDGNDYLRGSHGYDVLKGGSGDDHYRGGKGHDVFVIGDGYDTIYDFDLHSGRRDYSWDELVFSEGNRGWKLSSAQDFVECLNWMRDDGMEHTSVRFSGRDLIIDFGNAGVTVKGVAPDVGDLYMI